MKWEDKLDLIADHCQVHQKGKDRIKFAAWLTNTEIKQAEIGQHTFYYLDMPGDTIVQVCDILVVCSYRGLIGQLAIDQGIANVKPACL